MLAIQAVFSLLLAGFAAAQSSNSTGGIHAVPQGLGTVDTTTRNQWCNSQQGVCSLLCGGNKYVSLNKCVGATLTWTCTCQNGKEPENLDQYVDSLPEKECQQVFKVCNQANPGSDSCKQTKCGTLDAKTVKAGAGAKPTSSAAATSTGSSSETSAAAASAASQTGSSGVRYGPEMGFAAAVVGAMGVLL